MKPLFVIFLMGALLPGETSAQEAPNIALTDGQVAILAPFNINDGTISFSVDIALVEDLAMTSTALTITGGITTGFINAEIPVLTIRPDGAEMIVSWLATGFILEASPELGSGSEWLEVGAGTIALTSIRISPTGTSSFFRLRRP